MFRLIIAKEKMNVITRVQTSFALHLLPGFNPKHLKK
jgi:hypothetical protein